MNKKCKSCDTEPTNEMPEKQFNDDKVLCVVYECNCGRTRVLVPFVDGDGEVFLTD